MDELPEEQGRLVCSAGERGTQQRYWYMHLFLERKQLPNPCTGLCLTAQSLKASFSSKGVVVNVSSTLETMLGSITLHTGKFGTKSSCHLLVLWVNSTPNTAFSQCNLKSFKVGTVDVRRSVLRNEHFAPLGNTGAAQQGGPHVHLQIGERGDARFNSLSVIAHSPASPVYS